MTALKNQCPLCGKINPSTEWVCEDCGAQLPSHGKRNINQQTTQQGSTQAPVINAANNNPSKKGCGGCCGIWLVIFVAFVVWSYWWDAREKERKAKEAAEAARIADQPRLVVEAAFKQHDPALVEKVEFIRYRPEDGYIVRVTNNWEILAFNARANKVILWHSVTKVPIEVRQGSEAYGFVAKAEYGSVIVDAGKNQLYTASLSNLSQWKIYEPPNYGRSRGRRGRRRGGATSSRTPAPFPSWPR